MDFSGKLPGFQSTPPHGGDEATRASKQTSSNFNPRPLTGATVDVRAMALSESISIHAPSRGRRSSCSPAYPFQPISIHAPSRGRQWHFSHWFQYEEISIHAPSRGRQLTSWKNNKVGHFNPRPLTGATQDSVLETPEVRISIHAPSRGRPLPSVLDIEALIFQSTPPHGGD